MNSDPLERLLKQADASADLPPSLPGDLAQRIRRLHRRRRNVRIAGLSAGAAACVALALGILALVPHRPGQPIPPQQIAKAAQPPAPMVQRPRAERSPLTMPTMSFVTLPMPGPGAQGRFNADFPSFSIPTAVAGANPDIAMELTVPSVSLPSF